MELWKASQNAYVDASLNIVKITDLLARHAGGQQSWGKVGDMGNVNQKLEEIISFLKNEG